MTLGFSLDVTDITDIPDGRDWGAADPSGELFQACPGSSRLVSLFVRFVVYLELFDLSCYRYSLQVPLISI